MKYLEGLSLRSILFGVGAIGAVAEAIDIAQRTDIQVTPAHLIAVGCVALVAFALKYPGDLTAKDARELEARVKRESVMPSPGACRCLAPYRDSVTDDGACAYCGLPAGDAPPLPPLSVPTRSLTSAEIERIRRDLGGKDEP